MSYVALYRKFRPQTFSEVKGQEHIVTTLQNQLKAGRIGHAYLFCGTRGTGKTTVAKILARAVNCENPQEDGSPCNECASCASILSGTSTNVIEIDAASNNGVDNIREIREEVAYRPTQGRYKVYIIDEAHMLSTGAWNALLKTLEEPPEYVIFMLATTEVNKFPITILSRCQRYNFRRITAGTIARRLQELLQEEGVEAEDAAVRYIARAGDGSLRDALSLLDQCIAFYLGEKLTYGKVLDVLGTVDTDVFSALLRKVIGGDAAGSVRILQELIRDGREVGQFVSDFTWYLRNLMLVQSSPDLEDTLDVSPENLLQLQEESNMVDSATLMRYIHVLSELSGQLRFATQKQILVEVALIRLCRPQMDTDLSGVLDRIRVLEDKIENGLVMSAQQAAMLAQSAGQNAAGTGFPGGNMAGFPGGDSTAGFPDGNFPMSMPGGIPAAGQGNRPEPKKAAPEDLQRIAACWQKILKHLDMSVRPVYSQAGPPRYDSETGAPCLYLEIINETLRDMAAQADHLEALRAAVTETVGQELEFDIRIIGTGHGIHLDAVPLDERLAQEITVPIEEV